ncbi:hypothetical protein ABK040_000542 [Willaertia magna]
MPPKSSKASSSKGNAKGSGGNARKEDEVELNRKAIRKFLKGYEKACQEKSLIPLPSIVQKLTRLVKSEEGPQSLNVPFLITEECTVDALQILFDHLDTNFPHYQQLSFVRNNLCDKGVQLIAKWLQPNNHLLTLEIIDNRIGLKGCSSISRALQHNECLTKLVLDYNELGDDGSSILSMGIAWCPTLKYLSLNYCNINDEGAIVIGNEIIGKSTSIQVLELQGNPFQERGFQSIADNLVHAQKLTLLNLSACNDGMLLKDDCILKLCESIRSNQSNCLEELNLNLILLEKQSLNRLLNVVKEKNNLLRLKLYEKVDKEIYKLIVEQLQINYKAFVDRNKPKKKKKENKDDSKKKV